MLPQPFAITKIGPIALFVQDLEAVLDFYVVSLGFKVTEEGDIAAIGQSSSGMARSSTAWTCSPGCRSRNWVADVLCSLEGWLPDCLQIEDKSWQDGFPRNCGGVVQALNQLVRTIHVYGPVGRIDEPTQACAIIDVFLHFRLHRAKAVGW
jgi:hypothetical protein